MPAILELQNDAGEVISSYNFGAVMGGNNTSKKFKVKNVGTQDAESILLRLGRVAQNDGIDFATMASDIGGNPDTYSPANINVGTLSANAFYEFWVKVAIPLGTTPAGNPRQFDVLANYIGL